MGLRGPRPTPAAVLKARGSWRAKANKNQPTPESLTPPMPEVLSAEERVVWKAITEQLSQIRVLSHVDGRALRRYCSMFVRWEKAAAWLAANGDVYTVKDEAGNVRCVMPWPQESMYHKLGAALLKIEQEFGLTPAARTRVSATSRSEKPKDNKARFFGPRLAG